MKEYAHLFRLFDQHLSDYCGRLKNRTPAELYEPEAYILSLGGKRLRPLLALISCDLFCNDPARALDSALAVELFHNFSLIHDDILDAAPLRRKQPTVHHKWNTNIAILSGDVMLVKSLQTLANYEPQQFKQLTMLLQRTAIEVCEGQQQDMNFESYQSVSVQDYVRMIEYKTAVLLGCSLQMGAINAAADIKEQQHIYNFGRNLGIAFQLNDDLLDAYAGADSGFGKIPGGDIIANKKTFLLTRALESASEVQRQKIMALGSEQDHKKKIDGMLAVFNELQIKEQCLKKADRYTRMALNCLDEINAPENKKNNLRQFALELLERTI